MSGGGGSAPYVAPVYTDPVSGRTFDTSADLNRSIDERVAQEKAVSDAAVAQAAAEKQAQRDKFETDKAAAINTARGGVESVFSTKGLDPTQYADHIGRVINEQSLKIGDLDPNPYGAFDSAIGQNLFTDLQEGQQSQNLRNYNSTFDPNWSNTNYTDAPLQPAAEEIVGGQFSPIMQMVENAYKRGTLNDYGYKGAQTLASTKRTSALADVGNLGKNILGVDRGLIDTRINEGRSAAGNTPLGTSFDTNQYVTGANEIANRERGSFKGELLNAVGEKKYIDIQDLINAGGAAQGSRDPTTGVGTMPGGGLSPDAIAAQIKADNQQRGLGSSGAF